MNSKERLSGYKKDEISLSELIVYGEEYIKAVKNSWIFVVTFSLALAALSILYFSTRPTLYQARMSFMLNEDQGNQLIGMSSVLSQLGIPVMGQRINISKVLELSKSRKIIQEALFKEVEIEDRKDYLANFIIDKYELEGKWINYDKGLSNFRFHTGDQAKFSQLENFALIELCMLVAGTPSERKNAFLETDYGQNTTIMSYVVMTLNEEISYHLTYAIFEATSKFYVESSVEKQQNTYDVLKAKRDSTVKVYNDLERKYVVLSDRSQGLFTNKNTVKRERVRGEMLQMGSAIGKVEENLALVEFAIENSTPILQVIDAPLLPLKEIKTRFKKAMILGLGLGLVLSLSFIILRQLFRLAVA